MCFPNLAEWYRLDPSSISDASTAPVESTLRKFVDGSDQKISSTEVSTLPEPFLFRYMGIGGKV